MKQAVDILLVDDDKDICVMVEAILKFAGHSVHSCTSPDLLPVLLETISPRLLLMDMLLSGTDGRDICRRMKTASGISPVKIIMMSAHPDADKSCREAGADDFISKPFDMDHFIARVNMQLRAAG